MMIRRDEAAAFSVELAATTVFAFVLHQLDRKYDPDWSWLAVMVGILIAATPSMHLARCDPHTTWQDYERRAVVGFCVSGVVIIGWQLALSAFRAGAHQGYELATRMLEERNAYPTPPVEPQA